MYRPPTIAAVRASKYNFQPKTYLSAARVHDYG